MLRYLALIALPSIVSAQQPGASRAARNAAPPDHTTLLVPSRVWDGVDNQPHEGWAVLVRGDRIEAVGPRNTLTVPNDATTIDLSGTTVMPGLIEGHSHLL